MGVRLDVLQQRSAEAWAHVDEHTSLSDSLNRSPHSGHRPCPSCAGTPQYGMDDEARGLLNAAADHLVVGGSPPRPWAPRAVVVRPSRARYGQAAAS